MAAMVHYDLEKIDRSSRLWPRLVWCSPVAVWQTSVKQKLHWSMHKSCLQGQRNGIRLSRGFFALMMRIMDEPFSA